jgi:transcriptional regulator with XRE-family HTH domain
MEVLMPVQAQAPRQPDSVDVEVGRRVRVERIARGLSQTELAKQIGVTFQQVHKYESGQNRVSMGRLTRIGRVFGVDVTYLLGATKRRTPPPEPDPREQAELGEAMHMLGRTGAMRLLKAFLAIPPKPARLRDSIVALVESVAAVSPVNENPRQRRRSTKRSATAK